MKQPPEPDHLPYKIVIGLEVHVQLATRTKLFCRCNTQFGAPPNTQTCPVCIGLPGALPVMNDEAFRLSLQTALALNCQIPPSTKWDRKQYYYPDLPKGYQISQYDLPLSHDGFLEIHDSQQRFESKRVRIRRAHLEEDAGKSIHDERSGTADSRIDLNRTGTPLLEIVSEPDMSSALEARTFLDELKLVLVYQGVSDCNMQEGSLRVDANINLHIRDRETWIPTPIVEVKNMNSFRAVERALEFEADRQFDVWQETGQRLGDAPKQTRGWDDQAEVTRPQRGKEESSDYRYFPDPDLVPVNVSPQQLDQIRRQLGPIPAVLREQLQTQWGLGAYDADVLVNQGPRLVQYFTQLAEACGDAKEASNWVQQDVMRRLKEQQAEIDAFPVSAATLAELIRMKQAGPLDRSRAREVFQHMCDHLQSPQQAMTALGIQQVDTAELSALCRSLLDKNPAIVADVKAGKQQAIGSLVGQAKKQNPNVNPAQVKEICLQLIAEMS